VLTGIRRDNAAGTEAAFKYFLLGAFASAFFLYGIAFLYGVTGSTHLDTISSAIAAQSMSGNPMILLGVGLLIVGFAFKIAAVPFHMWSPTPTRARRRSSPVSCPPASRPRPWPRSCASSSTRSIRWWPTGRRCSPWIAAATMVLGTVVGWRRPASSACWRIRASRTAATCCGARAGSGAGSDAGKAAILFYLAAYSLTNLGAFGVIALLGTRERANDDLRDYAGLWHTHPAWRR
jgi:NADH-quinone oxidoreductase subunit N